MIAIELNSRDFEHDIRALLMAFFSDRDLCFMDEGASGQDAASVHVRIHTEVQLFQVRIWDEEKEFCAEAEYHTKNRKEKKNILKRTIYSVLHDYTGKELPWGTLTGIRPTKIALTMLQEGVSKEAIEEHLRQVYYTGQKKIDLSLEIAEREKKLTEFIRPEDSYSLYIGIPFCPTTCAYCSFTSYPIHQWKERTEDYLQALLKELSYIAETFAHKTLVSIYVGGGTPTTLEPEQLTKLLFYVREHFPMEHVREFCVEAGRPDSITKEKLLALKEAGVERISINPQTMKEETLKIIGRRHTVLQIKEAFQMAREAGFENINMDLIVGLPGETKDDMEYTMQEIKKLSPDSLTVHSLAIKRAAALNMFREQYQEQRLQENDQEIMDMTMQYARGMGMVPYYLYRQKNMAGNMENVGSARPDKCGLYNILIMEELHTFVAAGAGASTKVLFP